MANKPNNKEQKDVKKNSKDKRHFMKDFKAELKKVIWPTSKELLSNTVAVVTIVAIVSIIVLGLDIAFKTLNDQGINRLRTVVANDVQENTVSENTTSEDSTSENVENTTESQESSEENANVDSEKEVDNQ